MTPGDSLRFFAVERAADYAREWPSLCFWRKGATCFATMARWTTSPLGCPQGRSVGGQAAAESLDDLA
jgi:hypothetical protein